MPLVFRTYAVGRLTAYLNSYISQKNNITPESVGVVYKAGEEVIEDNTVSPAVQKAVSTSTVGQPSTSQVEPVNTLTASAAITSVPGTQPSASSHLPTTSLSAAAAEAMETDIDEMVDQIPMPLQSEPKNEDPLRNIPEVCNVFVSFYLVRVLRK